MPPLNGDGARVAKIREAVVAALMDRAESLERDTSLSSLTVIVKFDEKTAAPRQVLVRTESHVRRLRA